MEDSGVLESLDSLWFFSNVLSTITQPMGEGNTTKEDPTEPSKPIVQTQQNESRNPAFDSPRCPKCCEFSAESEPLRVEVRQNTNEEAETPKRTKKEEIRSRRRKRKSKRKVLGELDLAIEERYLWDWELNSNKQACGYGMFGIGSEKHLVKMPPLSDGMAMKEHLKCWAYAVACMVR